MTDLDTAVARCGFSNFMSTGVPLNSGDDQDGRRKRPGAGVDEPSCRVLQDKAGKTVLSSPRLGVGYLAQRVAELPA